MRIPTKTLKVIAWLSGVLIFLLACALAVYLHARLTRDLRGLPAPERRVLYERTLETLRTSCTHSPGPPLTDYCRDQANFIERFPECDSACRELAARFAPQPSR